MAYREVDCFASLLIQFPQVGQAQAPDIELPDSCLSNRETSDSEMMAAFPITVQEARADQISQKTMHRAHWQPRQLCHLLGAQPARELTKEMQQAQPALKSGNVVISLGMNFHKEWQK